ncbi:MAG: ABC transporter substrate-binding protein [Spirochaetales bacterium]|nr:ABC transporter substrate-binding protein [Spirochaetales bacterium]
MNFKRLLKVLLPLIALLILAGCQKKSVESTTAPVEVTKDVLVIDLVSEPTTLDPHLQWNPSSFYVYRNIFDNLLSRNSDGDIIPKVAESWDYVSETVVDLKIRDDINFQDGTPLTVGDVVYSVHRILDPELKSPQAGQFNAISNVEAIDDSTVRLTTAKPYPVLLAQLVKLSIVPEAYVEKVGNEEFNKNPVGSGPYKFVSWEKGIKVVVEANENYWGGTPPFKTVEFLAVPEKSTRLANLKTGKSDLITSLDEDLAIEVENDSKIKVLSVPTERIAYFRINTLYGPTADIKVRQAIAYGIDKKMIVEGLKGGYSKVANVMVGQTSFGYDPSFEGYPFDPEKAKALVLESGIGSTEIELLTAPSVFDQRVVAAIQQMLSDIGLKVKIVGMDMSTFLQHMQSDDSKDMTSFGRWSGGVQDADGIMYAMLHSGSQWANIKSEKLDNALDGARTSLDSDVRMEFYSEAHQVVQDEIPVIPLYEVGSIYGAAKELQWKPMADESLFIMDMKWGNS